MAPDRIRIAVDAMGGDQAPGVVVQGVQAALQAMDDIEVHLVGRPAEVEPLLGADRDRLTLVPAEDVVGMDEHPAQALRKKPGSSIAVCAKLLAGGACQALVSAGNTGAVAAAALFAAKLLPGVHRPGIAVAFPTTNGHTLLCDAGANINTKPEHYVQYAVMASAYSRFVLGVAAPRVALLSIGTEEAKGGADVAAARRLLQSAADGGAFDFVGAVEGNHIFEGAADVVVCDGFTGNVILKTAEGVGRVLLELLARDLQAPELGEPERAGLRRGLRRLDEVTDFAAYGGAPLLGIDGCAIIAHGRSDARAIQNAVRAARDFARQGVNEHIAARLAELPSTRGVA